MKKILAVLVICSPVCAMDYDSRLTNVETRLRNVETSVMEIKDVLNDKTDPNTGNTISGLKSQVENVLNILNDTTDSKGNIVLGLKSLVETNVPLIKPLRESIDSISLGMSGLTAAISNLPETIEDINNKINNGWNTFLEEKFQQYMEEKKIVLDIITACKINGDPTPEYIMETAEQLQECDLKTRRETLSEILNKLTLFERLLDGEKLESIQNYLNDTNVPDPVIKEIEPLLSNAIVDRDCIKVTGATKAFTRTTDLKRGLPHEGWMNPDYDYFAYRKYQYVRNLINQENARRQTQNAENEKANELAQAAYKAGINAANRMTFPAQNFTDLVTDYNRLLTHHDI
jgi:hypothetical protein